jgi:hypothetical protein
MTRKNGLLSTAALLLVGAIVGAVVAGCGIRPSGVISGQGAPQGAVTSLILYLIDHNALRPVARPLPQSNTADGKYVSPQQQALDALMQGPTTTEAAGGLTSDIPPNTFAFISQASDNNVLQVFVKSDQRAPFTQHAVDQVACTLITSENNTGAYSETTRFQVQVFDGIQEWQPQGCPVTTP